MDTVKTKGSDSLASKLNAECLKSWFSGFPLHGYCSNLHSCKRNCYGWNPAAEILNQIASTGENSHN